jgi:hypothetical protein
VCVVEALIVVEAPIAVKPKLYFAHHLWGWGEKIKK